MNFNEFNEKFQNASEEQKELLLFKFFLNIENKNEEIEKYITGSDYTIRKYLKMEAKAIFAIVANDMMQESRNEFSEKFDISYNAILENWIKLSSELKLTNSLELSNLFTYLLWNGYFSKTKVHNYQIEGRTLLDGFFSLDIMNGNGVCLNYSDMLKDFLNKSGINSSIIINYASKINRDNNAPELIKRKKIEPKLHTKISTAFLKPLLKKTGNHASTLIDEDGKLYIYDPTNLICAKIDDFKTASLIDGTGTFELRPYLSYGYTNSESEKITLEKLFDSSNLDSPYNKEDINLAWNNSIPLFEANKSLIEDCYSETKNDIEKISDNLAKCRKKVKQI